MLKKYISLICISIAVIAAVSIIHSQEQTHIKDTKNAALPKNRSGESLEVSEKENTSIMSSNYSDEMPAKNKSASSAAPQVSTQPSQAEEITEGYMLKSGDDGIEVYKSGESRPVRTIAFNIDSLPQRDRQMLSEGITVTDDGELQALLEDFTG